jgi:hypothetical protein
MHGLGKDSLVIISLRGHSVVVRVALTGFFCSHNHYNHHNIVRLLPRQWKEKVRGDLRIQLMYQSIEVCRSLLSTTEPNKC